jgi:putative IMPACT (imprinted ancient) family translation regulator
MGRPKLYADAAEKSRAYRARRAAEMVSVNRESLALWEARVERLAAAVRSAHSAGCPVASKIRGTSTQAVLDELTAWFEGRAAGSCEWSGEPLQMLAGEEKRRQTC